MDSKKASFESNHKELSASSSNEFNEVLEFTVSNYETLQQQKELGSRRSSVHRKSLEAIKKCITESPIMNLLKLKIIQFTTSMAI